MTKIDFITGFGRLLRDGTLRDLFAADPHAAAEQVRLRPDDRPAWRQLVPADVEFQAAVLLRKRLELVKSFIPETCRQLGEKLWPAFHEFARTTWPPEGTSKISDAWLFCQHLRRSSIAPVATAEWNRLNFAFSKQRIAWHWVHLPVWKGKTKRAAQIFFRIGGRWREMVFYVGW